MQKYYPSYLAIHIQHR